MLKELGLESRLVAFRFKVRSDTLGFSGRDRGIGERGRFISKGLELGYD